jgi:AraC family transcriptional activator of pobA
MQPAALEFVPNFMLYGEAPKGGLPDLIHIEALKDRSQRHDWDIKPHRHFDLIQIMRFQTSNVRIHLDGMSQLTKWPSILIVPTMVIHGFQFPPDVIGTVTTIPFELIQDAEQGGLPFMQQAALVDEHHEYFAYFMQTLDQIEDEYASQRPARDRALLSLIRLIGLWIERFGQSNPGDGTSTTCRSQAERRVLSFLTVVEQNYLRRWEAAEYGKVIGISKSQLTRDCRAVLEKSPLEVVHDRIIKEANRKLAYTRWPIAEISERLGFNDLGYFSRFYRQKTGETPTDYRARIRSRMGAHASSAPAPQKATA